MDTTTAKDKGLYQVQTVSKALDLLDFLAEEPPDATVAHIASHLALSRNKAFRLLATFEERGLVEKDQVTGCYRIGVDAVELAQKMLHSVTILRHAHPVLEELARKHNEAVYLTVVKGNDVLFLDMVDTAQPVKAAPLVGKRFPFFTNASGKVIRAVESRDILERLLKKRGRPSRTLDVATLETELNTIRSRGFAVDVGGLGDGIISVAVAVRDYAGKVVGALTVLGPSFRMMASRLEEEIIPSLCEGAEMLSMKFGYAPI